MASPKHYVPALDAIRGVAILGVFLFHSLGVAFGFDHLPWNGLVRDFSVSKSFLLLYPLTYGAAGVAVFFVVSGFCIHLSYATSSDKSWANFANRRLFRIYPPYLFALLLFFFVWPWGNFTDVSLHRFAQLFTHLFAIHNLDYRSYFGINPSFWSIAVELQLYAIYPLLIGLASRFGWKRALVVVALFEIGIRSFDAYHSLSDGDRLPRWLTASPLAYWLSWSIGAYVAKCYLGNESNFLAKINPLFVAIFAFGTPLFKPTAPFGFLAFSLLTAVVVSRIVSGDFSAPKEHWVYRHLSRLGVVSFSFYLLHQPILFLFPRVKQWIAPEWSLHPLMAFACLLLVYPFVLWISGLMFRYIEMPSVQLGKAFWRWRNSGREPIPAAAK